MQVKPVNLRVCLKCVLELTGSLSFEKLNKPTEKTKCAFCHSDNLCDLYVVSDYKEDK